MLPVFSGECCLYPFVGGPGLLGRYMKGTRLIFLILVQVSDFGRGDMQPGVITLIFHDVDG
jgi:hypothetical protein